MTTPVAAGRRRATLRGRLILLVLIVTTLSLVVVEVGLTLIVRVQLINERDATLRSVLNSLALTARGPNLSADLHALSAANPLRGGDLGWTLVNYDGSTSILVPSSTDPNANPDVGPQPPTGQATSVRDVNDSAERYRILALTLVDTDNHTDYLVAWVPLDQVTGSIQRLVLLEAVFTGSLLLLLGGSASVLIRRELRPLESVAQAADQIAGGALERRVAVDDPSTEVGRLGTAFNGMVDGISILLDQRAGDEQRLRQFVADASHELRTPVAAVRGYTDLYRAGALPDGAAVDRAMQRMGFEAKRMGALVDDLLTLMRAEGPDQVDRDRVDLVELLTGVVDDAAVIDRSRTWLLAGSGQSVTVVGDRLRLHQLFANLLANIRTHTPPGTTATVTVLPAVGRAAVRVADDGPGVSEEDLPKLFDRFYRAEKSRSRELGGTGLGLSIVAALAAAHGGEVMAGHNAGRGLVVTVVLPLASGTAAVPPAGARPSGGAGSSAGGAAQLAVPIPDRVAAAGEAAAPPDDRPSGGARSADPGRHPAET